MFHKLVTLLTVASATAAIAFPQEPLTPRLRPHENLDIFPTSVLPPLLPEEPGSDSILLVKVKSYSKNLGLSRGFDPGAVTTDSTAVATVLDQGFPRNLIGSEILLSDIDFREYTAIPLQPGMTYLVCATSSIQGTLTRVKRLQPYDFGTGRTGPIEEIYTARPNERLLSMAVATKAKKLPSPDRPDQMLKLAMIEALSTANGREALVISSIMYRSNYPQEGDKNSPLAPIPEPYRKVAEIGDSTRDPYRRLAAQIILSRWGVAGSPGEFMSALTKVAEIAPQNLEARDLVLFARNGFFREPTFYYKSKVRGSDGLKYDHARFVRAAVKCKNPAIQENLLGSLKPGDLDRKEAAALVRRFDDLKPANYSSRWWARHQESISNALESNENIPPKDFKHQGVWNEATQQLDMSAAIQYWKTTYHVN